MKVLGGLICTRDGRDGWDSKVERITLNAQVVMVPRVGSARAKEGREGRKGQVGLTRIGRVGPMSTGHGRSDDGARDACSPDRIGVESRLGPREYRGIGDKTGIGLG